MNNDKKIRVLIVDDEDRFRATTTDILKRRGFDVAAVKDGFEALENLKSRQTDVVILDLKMPGMDGNETLRSIKQIKPDVHVIMLTGHGTPDSALASLQNGMHDFLSKPCDVEILSRKIRDACGGDINLSQKERRVSDIMVPLSVFSTIHVDNTVSRAVNVIKSSFTSTMETGAVKEMVHRSALVVDSRNKVVGVLAFIDLLRGIQPPYMRLLKDRPMLADSIHIEPPDFSGLFTILARDLADKKVRDLMSEAPPSVRTTDNIMTALNRIITLDARRLLVLKGNEVVGVVREQDLFFELSHVIERGVE